MPPLEILGEAIAELLERIIATDRLTHLGREEDLGACRRFEARHVRVEWVAGVVEAGSEKLAQKPVGLVLNGGEVRVKPSQQRDASPGVRLPGAEAPNLGLLE